MGNATQTQLALACPCYQLAQVSVLTLCLKKAICNIASGWEVFGTKAFISSFNTPVVPAGLAAAIEFNKIDSQTCQSPEFSSSIVPGFKHDSGILCNPHPINPTVFQGTAAAMQYV